MATLTPNRLLVPLLSLTAFGPPPLAAQADQDAFFGLDKCWEIHLTVAEADLQKMYPEGGSRFGGLSQRGRYPWVAGRAEIGDHTLGNIGIRFKGNSTFWTTNGTLKKSYKLDFNRFEKGGRFLGLTKLNLQNNATDPTQIREAVSYEVFRAAGVPASRTCFARVYLTVTGRFEKEYLGNYTIVEQVDRRYLKRNFPGDETGLLLKPEGKTNAYLGETWNEDYEKVYIPKTDVHEARTKALIGFVKLLENGQDAVFHAGIDEHLDVSQFLNYAAVTAFLANLDSPFMLAHNYYLAVPDSVGKVVWLPWDLNLSLGGFRMAGAVQEELSVFEFTRMPLFVRLLKKPEFRKIYEQHLWHIVKGVGSPEEMQKLAAQARATTKAGIAQEADRSDAITQVPGRGNGLGRMMNGMFRGPNLDDFLTKRGPAVIAQLEGKSKGRPVGTNRFGGFGRTTASRRSADESLRDSLVRSGVLELPAEATVSPEQLLAGVDRLFATIDADQSGTLSRRELARKLRALRGQNASPSEARRILKEHDADKSRSLSAAEFRAAYEAGLKSWDDNGDGKLQSAELSRARTGR